MNGVVTRVLVEPDDEVTRGQPLVAVEAMKMEHLVRAPRDGRVRAVHASPGAMVQGGTTLVELHPETPA
jgi:biotin carboxyl carrier protein